MSRRIAGGTPRAMSEATAGRDNTTDTATYDLTLLPLVGLAALVLLDARRMIAPPRQQTG